MSLWRISKTKTTTVSPGPSGGVVFAKTASGYSKPAHIVKRLHVCHDVWNRTRNYVCMHYLPRKNGGVGQIEVALPP